jgi:hypothetical protein
MENSDGSQESKEGKEGKESTESNEIQIDRRDPNQGRLRIDRN